jgi:hypothetical protein
MPVMVKTKQRKIFNDKISHLVDEELIPKIFNTTIRINQLPVSATRWQHCPRYVLQLLSHEKSQNY